MNKEKIISTSNFKIENNIISFNDVLLQISNISSVSVEPVPKKKFNMWFIIIFALGLLGTVQSDKDIKGWHNSSYYSSFICVLAINSKLW